LKMVLTSALPHCQVAGLVLPGSYSPTQFINK
jgi:hypothetical protein